MKIRSTIILNREIKTAIIMAEKKPLMIKFFPRMMLVMYRIMTLVMGYSSPRLIIVNGSVKIFKNGLMVLFNR